MLQSILNEYKGFLQFYVKLCEEGYFVENIAAKAAVKYNGIDLMKFVCALLVIGIHVEPFSGYPLLDEGFGILTRIAVPFFFAASAFLYFRSGNNAAHLLKYVKRIFCLYLIWSLIYFFFDGILSGFSLNLFSSFLTFFFLKGYKHFWYLLASIVAIVMISLLDKVFKNKKYYIGIIALILFAIGAVFSTYYLSLSKIGIITAIHDNPVFSFFGTRNGFYYAPIFVYIGYLFSRREEKPCSLIKHGIRIFLCFVLLAIESFIVVKVLKTTATILWFSTIPLIYCIMNFAIHVNIQSDLKLLRKCSIAIYCVHPLFIKFLLPYQLNHLFEYVVIFLMSIGFSFCIYLLSTTKAFRWLKIIL